MFLNMYNRVIFMSKEKSAAVSTNPRSILMFLLNFALFSVMLALACIFLFVFFQNFIKSEHNTAAYFSDGAILCRYEQNIVSLVIDAGHGGEDGGAVSSTGILEKDLNLRISLTLNDIFSVSGVNAAMTRTDDRMLYNDASSGKKKSQDLKNRVLIAADYPDSLFVSIHMNKFAESKYSGLQVYYSKNNPESKTLADKIQSFTKEYLQPNNNRLTKEVGSGIYLLEHINTPAVLVECGFLSNETEAAKLNDPNYQKKLSCVIYAAVIDHLISSSAQQLN